MCIRMVLHTVQFMNSFPWKGGLKHYPLSAIMNGTRLHMNQLQLKFGSYCQVAEDVTPRNSLAARTYLCSYIYGAIWKSVWRSSLPGFGYRKNDCPESLERTTYAHGCY